ncbi:MAG: ammonium transporter [Pseudomonadota bacterium]
MLINIFKISLSATAVLLSTTAFADTAVGPETGYLLTTFLLLVCGMLVMFMAAGFAMLEAGTVRSKSVATILAKNISLYAIASVMFLVVGYQLMYGAGNAFIGSFEAWRPSDIAGADLDAGQPEAASWFFQMVFSATTASVISGALAERVKFWPFAIFVALLTGILYPLVGHWTWGGGWLAQLGFSDFAGSTIVHSVGGWAALAGIVLLGARQDRFNEYGTPQVLAPSSLPMVTLGTFILWLGWFGFNGGSQLAFSTAADAHAVATVIANTNGAAAGGVLAATFASQLLYRRLNLITMLNGALAGLVSITAEPLLPSLPLSVVIGAAGALVMIVCSKLLERARLDDVVGAIPVHLAAGIWGTLAVALSNPDVSLLTQATGVAVIGAFTFGAAFVAWYVLRRSLGIRLKRHHEREGGDLTEVGMRAYNIG